ncbi:branched-chain amino acid transporter AzlC [Gemmobacter lanyuensis]|uniref:Branched-chain amino acid transporter AzlC n=1 Tax=Gemmobacter lanyuensis TaxID=1054497 RepID=A0A918IQ65_9RHOB|nr:AzlC family ABC transporter permease [Gemmobacter lanyuensis]GGW26017.1 branched-chain amino acid transporter AzlC [Gemmobacter lanyuensis]
MLSPSVRSTFLRGLRASLPFTAMIVPFGALFGIVARAHGLSILEAMAFSIVVIAGASQFAALQLMQEGAPLLIVILTATAVNLRMAMYSVAMAPHLGRAPLWQRALVAYVLIDQSYLLGAAAFERERGWSLAEKLGYYFGSVVLLCGLWYLATWVGAAFGALLPQGLAIDFIVPVTFLAMISPMLLTRAQMAAALVSIGLSLALWWMPYSSGLLVAALCAMATGAAVETWEGRNA